jgi:hypothetical protein
MKGMEKSKNCVKDSLNLQLPRAFDVHAIE